MDMETPKKRRHFFRVERGVSRPVGGRYGPGMTEVTGPVTGGAHGWAFSLPMFELDAIDCVAEEFFIEGTATAYRAVPGSELHVDGAWDVEPSGEAPFRTRMLVVGPRGASRFNGGVQCKMSDV